MTTHYTEGAYRCEILDQGLSQSKNGNPQIWLKILPEESLDDPGMEMSDYERTVYWTLTDKTVDFVVEKLKALGFTGQSFRQLDPSNQNHESFVGQIEDFWCKHEFYNGENREKWDLSRGDVQQKPLDESEARKLDALFGKKLAGGTAKATKNGAKKPAEKKPAKTFDEKAAQEALAADPDIPF